jgi:hypothetical protein
VTARLAAMPDLGYRRRGNVPGKTYAAAYPAVDNDEEGTHHG